MDDLTTRAAKLLWAKLPAPHTCPDEIDAAARAVVALVLQEAQALRDELADEIGAKPTSSIHSALCEYANKIRALGAAMSDPTPHARRSPMEHERDAGDVSLLDMIARLTEERDALRAKLDVAKQEILSASLFAAELAESIGPSDEWSHDFKEGYIFGGRDAARMIRQKCTFPDAALSRKATP